MRGKIERKDNTFIIQWNRKNGIRDDPAFKFSDYELTGVAVNY